MAEHAHSTSRRGLLVGVAGGAVAAPLPTPAETRPRAPLTLSTLAAPLGELEPPDDSSDVLPGHIARQNILIAAAPSLPVTSAADATFALCIAAHLVDELRFCDVSRECMLAHLARVERVLGQVARWTSAAHGGPPILTHFWTDAASPYVPAGEVA